jgi:hypothetical protein
MSPIAPHGNQRHEEISTYTCTSYAHVDLPSSRCVTPNQGHEGLKSLEVGYNPLGPEGTRTLVNVVKFDLKVRVRLRVRRCDVRQEITP